jgi:alpha-L-fucosidase
MDYKPTWESVSQHPVPDWYHDAKFGIFVHWGLYSVPAWAPLTGEMGDVTQKEGFEAWFTRNPYAEWYLNSLRIEGSPTHQHHVATYGGDFAYEDFAPIFNEATRNWNPAGWADLFQKACARYVVLTTKHHDGFLMWPSQQPNPFKRGYHAERDLVGELTDAVRAHGMLMGLYYSGGLDWTFTHHVIKSLEGLFACVPQSEDYVKYADAHWLELIERYGPVILWNDIAYPAAADLPRLFADYYNYFPDGVVNDRFLQRFEFDPNSSAILNVNHHDFRTPEYATSYEASEKKWEATRGIGFSFGYNQNEGPEQYLTLERLVHTFADIVSKNGNLLLNVGPMADGTIPEFQRDLLVAFGGWLKVNGEALFDTRPWVQAEGRTTRGAPVRFTEGGGPAYAVVLAQPAGGEVVIESLRADADASVHLLGHEPALRWRQHGDGLAVTLPDALPEGASAWPAYALRITPAPEILT